MILTVIIYVLILISVIFTSIWILRLYREKKKSIENYHYLMRWEKADEEDAE